MPKKVMEINAQMYEKYVKIDVTIHLQIIETTVFLGDLQNLDFCDTSAVKTWFCMCSDGQQSMKAYENLIKNPRSKKLGTNSLKNLKNT